MVCIAGIEVAVFTYLRLALVSLFFFFQAEDGIRDRNVTGVQTCALPISSSLRSPAPSGTGPSAKVSMSPTTPNVQSSRTRSEERRVGKECRCRWSPDD